ncbi:MAG: hypothetical protein U1A23_00785 [Candidatus Sungbacteria bacterium]|nr:hypothetical protein [bacterium]MDZ4285443.1 hypothetical protein [Candidatus Sungbacteria bacterium]
MNIFSRLKHSVAIRVAHVYFMVRGWWPIWFYVINRKNRRAFREYAVVCSAVQKRIAEDLARDGIAVAHLDELFPGKKQLSQFQQYVQEHLGTADTRTHKIFLRNLWDAVPSIDVSNPFVPLALADAILGTVNEYMQMCSYFFYLTLNVTTPVVQGSEAVQSQRWHGDPEDKKMCKVFLYLTDVDETAGPFIYVRGTQLGGRWRHLFREQQPRGFLAPKRPIEELVSAFDITKFTGRAGTIIFCDTSGYHRGGYATAKERIMLTMGYCSQANAYPIRVRFEKGFADEVVLRNVSPAAQFALGFVPNRFTSVMFRVIKPHFKYGAY